MSRGLTRRALLAAAASASLGTVHAAQPLLAPGTHRIELDAPRHGATSEPLPLHLYVSTGWSVGGPVVFVMHGVQRDAERYLASWQPLAEQAGLLLVVPEFSRRKFPGNTFYNFGHVLDARGERRPREGWAFSLIDASFDRVRRSSGATRAGFAIYGHSAGAQFAHRYLLMAEQTQATLLISANAGSYTLPDEATAYPYGLKGSGLTPDDLRRALARPVVILLGEEDTDPQHPSLSRVPQALAQGPHRLARGQHFFAEARRAAEKLDTPFHWRLATVPGADHDDAKMAPAALRLIQQSV